MKRGAEKQISKDDDSDDIQESGQDSFKKADDTVLASRKIRGLPKRSLAGTPPSTTNGNPTLDASPTPASKFGAFAGFGSPASNTNPFSFTPLTTSPEFTTSPSQPSQSLPQSAVLPSPSLFASSSTPLVTHAAYNAAKTFASSASDATFRRHEPIVAPPPSFRNMDANGSPPYNVETNDGAELNYYTSLRGLNISVLSALSRAIESDPFVDAADVLTQYQNLRLNVKRRFDDRTVAGERSSITSSTSTAPPLKPTSMPAPPLSFAGFSHPNLTSTSMSVEPSGKGASIATPDSAMTPSSPASSFPFHKLPHSTATPSTPALSKPFLSGSKLPSTDRQHASIFDESVLGTSLSTHTPSAFGMTKPGAPSTGSFGAFSSSDSLFGTGTSTIEKLPTDTASTDSKTIDQSQPTATTNPFSTSIPSNTPQIRTTFSSFGGFGKPGGVSGSIGNPVGFGFGSPSKTPNVDVVGSSGMNESGFEQPGALGTSADSRSTSAGEGGDAECGMGVAAEDSENGEGGNSNPELSADNTHDEEGGGEEGEDTIHAIKLKAYKLKKESDRDSGGWTELGYGVLRLKKNKESGVRRILLRNGSTGQIIINFNIYPGLKPLRSKKSITFIGHDNNISRPYTLRLQSEEQAIQLENALEREIAFVKIDMAD